MSSFDPELSEQTQRAYFALNALDRKLERHLDFDGGVFFEAGANDGQNQSNTLYFERYRGWSGILVEPIPQRFLQCRALRGASSQCFWAALTPPDWPDPFVELTYCNLMTVTHSDKNALDPDAHVARGLQFLQGEEPYRLFAPARTVSSILEEAQVERIDLFSLDVEGFEVAALEGLDLSRFDIRYLCIECRDLAEVQAVLGERYELLEKLSMHDYLFKCR